MRKNSEEAGKRTRKETRTVEFDVTVPDLFKQSSVEVQ